MMINKCKKCKLDLIQNGQNEQRANFSNGMDHIDWFSGKEVAINLFSNDRKKEKQFEYDENNIGKIWKCLFLSFYVNVNGIFKERYIKIMNEKYP